MPTSKKQISYLKDYKEPPFFINTVNMLFELTEEKSTVTTTLNFVRNPKNYQDDLELNGENLELIKVFFNDSELAIGQYIISEEKLIIKKVPNEFNLRTVVRLRPQENTQLSGLYKSNGTFCTQCEAEGFRRITYFLDRPDIMARYTVKIIADKKLYPQLLSNGNPIESGELDGNMHFVSWEDPYKKPCYLFALVAGDLDLLEDQFISASSRKIMLRIFVEKGNKEKARYAMSALKQAMAWDERKFDREYDLDIFMIVAVSDFNMGAMENKGLNIFNDKYILANSKIATDTDYENILQVIGHEYFHNWTGNRITCRDWFQLSLKEGLTIYRDQEFSADMTNRDVKRIKDAAQLRSFQYPEDAGPMAHSVQPDSYIQIDNFYTHTIYEKGAEIIRMMENIVTKEKFREGMLLYFERHDGQAVTIEEFVKAIEDASKVDLTQFRRWYKQKGTPIINVDCYYDATIKQLILTISQNSANLDIQEKANPKPLHIPIAIGLLTREGEVVRDTTMLELKEKEQTFYFDNISEPVVPSLLRSFSAPVIINYDYDENDLAMLMTKDNNAFSQWEASQCYIKKIFMKLVETQPNQQQLPENFLMAYKNNLLNPSLDNSFKAQLLSLPTERYLMHLLQPIDVEAAHSAYTFMKTEIAMSFKQAFYSIYESNYEASNVETDIKNIAKRKLVNTCLTFLSYSKEERAVNLAIQQYQNNKNMTDNVAALQVIINSHSEQRQSLINDFYQRFKHEHLVIDKWFSLQAMREDGAVFSDVEMLIQHPVFTIKNPNRLRALIAVFCMHNPYYFNRHDGKGYELLTGFIMQLNQINPQIAARLIEPLTYWGKFKEPYRHLMREQLTYISSLNLSPDLYEVVQKSLGATNINATLSSHSN